MCKCVCLCELEQRCFRQELVRNFLDKTLNKSQRRNEMFTMIYVDFGNWSIFWISFFCVILLFGIFISFIFDILVFIK